MRDDVINQHFLEMNERKVYNKILAVNGTASFFLFNVRYVQFSDVIMVYTERVYTTTSQCTVSISSLHQILHDIWPRNYTYLLNDKQSVKAIFQGFQDFSPGSI